MTEYIYFVKRPGCEDEHFDYLAKALDFARSCLDKKPIITQTEVNRNYYGECTDSSDLGTVWSWEDAMSAANNAECPDEGCTTFSKAETFGNREDVGVFRGFDGPLFSADTDEDSEVEIEIEDDTKDSVKDSTGQGGVLTIERLNQLVEEMEENEDTVECKCCNELFPKTDCVRDSKHGWLCKKCKEALNKQITESFDPKEIIDLYYDELTVSICGPKRDVDDWDEAEYSHDYTYKVEADEVATVIFENFLTDEDVADVPGGFETLEDDTEWNKFLDSHFEALVEKYYNNLLDYYQKYAEEELEANTSWSDCMSDEADEY